MTTVWHAIGAIGGVLLAFGAFEIMGQHLRHRDDGRLKNLRRFRAT